MKTWLLAEKKAETNTFTQAIAADTYAKKVKHTHYKGQVNDTNSSRGKGNLHENLSRKKVTCMNNLKNS